MIQVTDKMSTPPGGWRYTQPESGYTMVFLTFAELLSAVYKHRVANGYDTAEGWQDRFAEQLCRQLGLLGTNWCSDTEAVVEPQGKRGLTAADVKRFLGSVAKMVAAGGDVFVDQATADSRSAVCKDCLFNTDIRGCLGCNGIAATVGKLLGQRRAAHHGQLKNCGVCGCANRVKVWIKTDVIDNSGLEYPPHCWQLPETSQRDD